MDSYVELLCHTHYSFLRGASHPKELVDSAALLGLKGLAITDVNGVYGLPKAFLASKTYPEFKLISGAQISISNQMKLSLIAKTRDAYGLLCRILTAVHHGKPKGQGFLHWHELTSLMVQKGGPELIVIPELSENWNWPDLHDVFKNQIYLPLSRFLDGNDLKRTKLALDLRKKYQIPILATNQVYYHHATRQSLQDVLTCIREGVPLDEAGYLLFSNQERYLKSPHQMARLFSDLPEALSITLEIADQCTFSLSELKYRYPSEWIPQGHTAQSYLSELVWAGALNRYSQLIPTEVENQLKHELELINQLQFADYFLTIWEIVEFAKKRKILCQGRGSAANSAVCFVLGITAIDPVRMNFLFERFISTERGEPPDIDVDFEHERREEVIQHIYEKYGRDRAAMVAAVITYRTRSATREVTKCFGKEIDKRKFLKLMEQPNPSPEISLQSQLIEELKGFPRHLSIHSGGFTLSADPLIETVPVEPATMEGRTIVQWDKYDLDALGLLKVDVLSLGMLTALRKTMNLIGNIDFYSIPSEDPKTYEMIQRADTIGTFQIESRAQMSMLPRLLPKNFYDLVIEVAIVRPGPIVGKMVHPYLKRRKGLEPVSLPDPRLKPILGRTLGVPIFQEQVMKIAILLANFTPGEADQLRRAIGAWRSSGSIDQMGKRLMKGLLANGIPRDFADSIFMQIQGFSEYGFPESHSASFALIAYASAYLKCHYPAEFTCGLLNSQPLGFYSPHTLVDDVKRHGVKVFPIHPHISQKHCQIENKGIRLGFRYVSGISDEEIEMLLKERNQKPFQNLFDFLNRCHLRKNIIHRLALGDAFQSFGYDQRSALWAILFFHHLIGSKSEIQLSLFSEVKDQPHAEPLQFSPLNELESIQADYQSFGLSTRGHPMQALRKRFPQMPRLTTAMAKNMPSGRLIHIAGLSVVMQRPPTAKGTVFATIEDETGFLDLILHAKTYEKFKELILDHCFLVVSGKIQKEGLSINMIVQKVATLEKQAERTLPSNLTHYFSHS